MPIKPFLTALLAVLMAVPAAAQSTPPEPQSLPTPPSASAADAAPAGLAGAYLAARQAMNDSDFVAASRYFRNAVTRDPADSFLQDSALVSLVSSGDVEAAVTLATAMQSSGQQSELAGLVQRIGLAQKGDWTGVLRMLKDKPSGDANGGELLDGLVRGWALMGAGKASEGFAVFEKLSKQPDAGGMARFQLALAKASVGDYEAAERLLRSPDDVTHLLGIQARIEVLSQLERNDDAIKLLDSLDQQENEPVLVDLRRRLAAGERLGFTTVPDASHGLAQVLLTFAGALSGGEDSDPLALLYARMASYLSPDLGEAHLMSAQLLQSMGQFDLAEKEFEDLRKLGDMRPVAELSRIDALTRAERLPDAEKAARTLTEARPDLAPAWVALGDLLRQQDKFADAVPVYDKALAILQREEDPQASWFALYARGISLERSGRFDRADADFQAALKLQPDQAPILNYLGYSWVDRNVRLDEALKLIERAVELRPDDGYILDSLAWAYYRLGRYQDAVAPMEKSVSAMSNDSLVNDHMGDIYWMAGRKREAEIQWRRALSLYKPADSDTDLNRIRAKLEVGLDAVIAAERANGGKLPEGFGQPKPAEPIPASAPGKPAPAAPAAP